MPTKDVARSILHLSKYVPSVDSQLLLYVSCGFAEAVPRKILDIMNVQGLTRENVASHLQVSFRMTT